MDRYQPTGAWRLLTHPVMVVFWFILALLVPLAIGYLNTSSRYVLDFKLLFFGAAALIGVAWLMNLMLMPLLKTTLILPLLGIVSFVSLLMDIGDEIHYWAAFQWHVPWLDAVIHILLAVIFLLLVRGLLRNISDYGQRQPRRIWLVISIPFLVLFSYNFFESYNYFADLHGRVPVFHHGLSQWTLPGTESSSIEQFFGIDNSNQK
ncbi:hypothetical protein KRX19_01355 [Cardiobacteriaceae bacterium TAE3-ERU3]|nr:hypothetical protein [Cardiobacteriaceae bacterium TAE3-ERU3]